MAQLRHFLTIKDRFNNQVGMVEFSDIKSRMVVRIEFEANIKLESTDSWTSFLADVERLASYVNKEVNTQSSNGRTTQQCGSFQALQ